jgi:hypothetical protein
MGGRCGAVGLGLYWEAGPYRKEMQQAVLLARDAMKQATVILWLYCQRDAVG